MRTGPTDRWPGLRGRRDECEKLTGLVQAARSGRSAVLVVLGEPGIGKTALLEYLAGAAGGSRILRVSGVESQMELAFAGLHQLCEPLLDRLDRLPDPQADALGTAFGLRAGAPPDRFLVGLAALSLLSEGASAQPLLCVVDDAQWLDQASAHTIAFVARRLAAEAVVLVIAARTSEDHQRWAGLPRLAVAGLAATDAETLLEWSVQGPLDERIRHRILAEAHGNPLALLQLPQWLTATELTFGPDPARSRTLASRMEEAFRRQLEPLPDQSRRLLLTAAAEPLGDIGLLWRAAEQIGFGTEAAGPAERAGLIELRETVRFRHPLVRSAAYRSAGPRERQAVHRALAEATDPVLDPDRRAWHRAHAATGPDETVAAELEDSAGRALAHGGLAAAAAFLERAAMLTPDPVDRIRRQLTAAEAMLHAGTFDDALTLLVVVENGPLTPLQRARLDVLRAQIGFASARGNEALPLLLTAARQLEPLDNDLALDSYVDALTAALFAGRLASGPGPLEVAQAARSALASADHLRRGDVLLHGVATLFADGYAAAAPLLREATQAFGGDELTMEEGVRFMWLAAVVASDLWDEQAWDRLTRHHLKIVRDAGALSALPLALNTRVFVDLFAGNLMAAASAVEEIRAVTEAAESKLTPYAAIGLAAFRGHEEYAAQLISDSMRDVRARGEGIGVSLTNWAQALLYNGLSRYSEALAAAREAAAFPAEIGVSNWGLVELVEAAVRAGDRPTAVTAFEQLSEMTRASGTDWALGVAARSEAQLQEGKVAEDLYREAIDRLERANVRAELVRAWLLYGEWLRREGRRVEARVQLRTAYEAATAIGMDAFAARAHHELAATGETPRKRTAGTDHSSPRRSCTSPGSRSRGFPIPRSAPSCSSARARWNGTCARCSRSSASARANTSARPSTTGRDPAGCSSVQHPCLNQGLSGARACRRRVRLRAQLTLRGREITMRVFVAGGTGVVGRPLVDMLVDRGHQVAASTARSANLPIVAALGARPVLMDGLDASSVRRAIIEAEPEVVVNLMTALSVPSADYATWIETTNRLRSEGTKTLMAAAREVGSRRVVAQSASFMTEPGSDRTDESSPLYPTPPPCGSPGPGSAVGCAGRASESCDPPTERELPGRAGDRGGELRRPRRAAPPTARASATGRSPTAFSPPVMRPNPPSTCSSTWNSSGASPWLGRLRPAGRDAGAHVGPTRHRGGVLPRAGRRAGVRVGAAELGHPVAEPRVPLARSLLRRRVLPRGRAHRRRRPRYQVRPRWGSSSWPVSPAPTRSR